jgi:cell division protein FtsL
MAEGRKPGLYSKEGRSITQPKLEVNLENLTPAPQTSSSPGQDPPDVDEDIFNKVVQAVIRLDKAGKLVLNKRTLTLIAVLLVTMLGALAYGAAELMTKQAQLEETRNKVHDLEREIDLLHTKDLEHEIHIVELETQLENLRYP